MDYTSILISLFGTGNMLLLSLVLMFAIFGAINGIRGEVLKFFVIIAIIGLSVALGVTVYVVTVAVMIFSFYYGKKIYKGVKRE